MLGFLAGLALVWVSRITSFRIVAALVPSAFGFWGNSSDDAVLLIPLFLPVVLLASCIYWAARKRRKGLAVGMALYGAVAALFLVWFALRIALAL